MLMQKPNWRLIVTHEDSGAWNMALDEALLSFTSRKINLPTLRLYSWNPACLSLGYAQSVNDVDIKYLEWSSWDLVRRPTGGRAILHTDEITYSITASHTDPVVSGTLMESYQRISSGLVKTLQFLGVSANADKEYSIPHESNRKNPVCFETPSNYEITANGKKLIGSAQARKSGGILQHGSLPLVGDLTRITNALTYKDETLREKAAERLLEHACTLESVLERVVSLNTAIDAFTCGFSEALNINLVASNPTVEELDLAKELLFTKYGSSSWTNRI